MRDPRCAKHLMLGGEDAISDARGAGSCAMRETTWGNPGCTGQRGLRRRLFEKKHVARSRHVSWITRNSAAECLRAPGRSAHRLGPLVDVVVHAVAVLSADFIDGALD